MCVCVCVCITKQHSTLDSGVGTSELKHKAIIVQSCMSYIFYSSIGLTESCSLLTAGPG